MWSSKKKFLNPNLIKLKICSVRKAQFEKWSYDHNRKGPSQHECQHQSSYKSVETVFCCSRVTVNKPWFLHEKLIFNLLGSKFFLCSWNCYTGRISWKDYSCKISPEPVWCPWEHTIRILLWTPFYMLGTVFSFSLLSSFSLWGSIFSLVKSNGFWQRSHTVLQVGTVVCMSVQWRV